jgi:hypothetical protein
MVDNCAREGSIGDNGSMPWSFHFAVRFCLGSVVRMEQMIRENIADHIEGARSNFRRNRRKPGRRKKRRSPIG